MDETSIESLNHKNNDDQSPKEFRFRDFDLARGIAVIFMILQHTFYVYGNYPTSNPFDSIIIEIAISLGGFSAPVFMLLMGIFFGYNRENNIKYGVTRGLKLICLGYVLNVFRFALPFTIGTELMGLDYPILFEDYPSPIWEIFYLDILQFAGLALIVLSLIERFCKDKELYYFIVVILSLFLALFYYFFITNSPLDFFLGYFWRNPFSGFPLFPTLFFPCIGLIIGKRLKKTDAMSIEVFEKIKFNTLIFTLIGILVTGFVVFFLISTFIIQAEFSLISELTEETFLIPGIMLVTFLLIFPLYNMLIQEIPKNPGFKYIYFLSKYITVVYFIQWVLIGWGIIIFGVHIHNALICSLLFILILPLTSFFTFLYIKTKTFLKK